VRAGHLGAADAVVYLAGGPLFDGRRAWLPVPGPFVRMGLGAVTDILVRGKRVPPAKAVAAGYQFRFPAPEQALRDIVDGRPGG
jgi:NAD dependent epimerase/dehydratase family enzyme